MFLSAREIISDNTFQINWLLWFICKKIFEVAVYTLIDQYSQFLSYDVAIVVSQQYCFDHDQSG